MLSTTSQDDLNAGRPSHYEVFGTLELIGGRNRSPYGQTVSVV